MCSWSLSLPAHLWALSDPHGTDTFLYGDVDALAHLLPHLVGDLTCHPWTLISHIKASASFWPWPQPAAANLKICQCRVLVNRPVSPLPTSGERWPLGGAAGPALQLRLPVCQGAARSPTPAAGDVQRVWWAGPLCHDEFSTTAQDNNHIPLLSYNCSIYTGRCGQWLRNDSWVVWIQWILRYVLLILQKDVCA